MLRAAIGVALFLTLLMPVVTAGADAVPTVDVSGIVVGIDGEPTVVEWAKVEEYESEDADAVVTEFDVADDGTFTVALREWGTAEAPARALLMAFGPAKEPVVDEQGCTTITQPFGVVELTITGDVPTEPIEIVMDQQVEEGLCPPATATPQPEAPSITLPPTDAAAVTSSAPPRATIDALLLVSIGLLAVASLARQRARRQPSPRH